MKLTEKQRKFIESIQSMQFQCVVKDRIDCYGVKYGSYDYVFTRNIYFKGMAFPVEVGVWFTGDKIDYLIEMNCLGCHPVETSAEHLIHVIDSMSYRRDMTRNKDLASRLLQIMEDECNKIQDILDSLIISL